MAEHASKAYIGHGSQFLYNSTTIAAGALVTDPMTAQVNDVLGFETPEEVADDIEVSHLESPGKVKEYVRGMIESGEISFDIHWNPVGWSSHAALRTQKADGLNRFYQFKITDGVGGFTETFTFPGYIKQLKRNVPGPNDPVTATVTIKLAGASTIS